MRVRGAGRGVATRLREPFPERPASRRLRLALVGALALVALVRLLALPDVYYGGVVLPANDPYAYRHAVDQLLGGAGGPWAMPAGVARGEPLFVTTLWLASAILGGSTLAVDLVFLAYPVVSAVLAGYLVYAIGTRASEDARVGVAAVALFAVTPAHAYRTSVGFADHHAFDFLWLALTGYCLLVVLTRRERDASPWPAAVGLGVGVAGQVLAWAAGPLLVVPVAVVLLAGAVVRLRDRTIVPSLAPAVAGLGLGAALTLLAHAGLGWHELPVVATTWLLFAGGLGLLALTTVARRRDLPWAVSLAPIALALLGGLLALVLVPELSARVASGLELLVRETPIGEMSTLVEDYGVVLGPLIVLGFASVLALVAVPLALRAAWRERDPAWLVVVPYVAYFAALAFVQRRFAGELSPFLAALAGLGLVAGLGWLEVVRPPSFAGEADGQDVPLDRSRLAILGGVSAVFLGTGTLYTSLITGRMANDDGAVRAARWMREYARERAWSYPDNYVLSEWDRNRMYNYVVNGESASYGYARRHYEAFLSGRDGAAWFDRLAGRVGFVVTRDFERLQDVPPTWLYPRLHEHFGSATADAPGLGHYRAVYASADGAYKVFSLVPGATITGTVDEGIDRLSTAVSIENATFEYVRTIGEIDGEIAVTVAHPGTYRIGDAEVVVEEPDVVDGADVPLE